MGMDRSFLKEWQRILIHDIGRAACAQLASATDVAAATALFINRNGPANAS
jgi:hypothetical protein